MAGELILIVEDNEKNLKLVRDVLQFNGYRTLEAETGHDAIAMATEHAPQSPSAQPSFEPVSPEPRRYSSRVVFGETSVTRTRWPFKINSNASGIIHR